MNRNKKFLEQKIRRLRQKNTKLKKQLKLSQQKNKPIKNKVKKAQINLIQREEYIEKIEQEKIARDQFFNLSLDLLCISNFDGYFIEVNPIWEEKLGYSKEELLSQPYINFVHPEDVENTLKQVENPIQISNLSNFENRYRCRDGNYLWLSWTAVTIVSQKIIYAVAHDITQQKQLEIDLKASREQLLSIVESLPGGIVYADKNLHFLYVNQNYAQWIEKSKEQIIGKHFIEILGEKAYLTVKSGIEEVLNGQNARFEGKFPIYNGKVYDVDARLVPDFNHQGEVNGYYALVYDVSERAKAQAKIRLQWNAINAAIDGISILKQGKFLSINQSQLEMFGYQSAKDIIGKRWVKLCPNQELIRFKREILPILQEKKSWHGEIIAQKKDNTNFIAELSLTLIEDDLIVVVCQDITEKKEAEDALRIAEENYRSIFENALEGIFQSTPEGKYLRVNSAMAQIYGYEFPEKMMAYINYFDDKIYVDINTKNKLKLSLDQQDKINNFEYQIYSQTGQVIWVQENTRAVRDNQDNLLYYEGIIHDITDRKRKEAILEKQIQELRTGIDRDLVQKEVHNIVNSDFFQDLKANINEYRGKNE